MPRLLFIILILFSFNLNAQDFSEVDQIVINYPNNFNSPAKLAKKINADFNRDIDKVRAIYRWIAENVEYDIELFRDLSEHPKYAFSYRTNEERITKEIEYHNQMADETIKTKMAICDGYSSLFLKLCELCNIEAEVITGSSFTNPNDIGVYPSKADHSWNAVRISNKWHLVDVTWAAGSSDDYEFYPKFSDAYFLQSPKLFAQKHYPDDSYWLLAEVDKKDIRNIPLFFNSYYEEDIELLSPKKGAIHFSETNNIEIKIKSENDYFFYNLSYSQFLEEAHVKSEGNIHTFNIPIDNKNGLLTIYYFRNPILTFKILY